jgi:hypothetical protein
MAENVVQRHDIAAARLDEARSECSPEFIDYKPHVGVLEDSVVI